jgi:hypothetical protein
MGEFTEVESGRVSALLQRDDAIAAANAVASLPCKLAVRQNSSKDKLHGHKQIECLAS